VVNTTEQRLEAIETRLAELVKLGRLVDSLAGSLNDRLDLQNENLAKLIRFLQGKDEPWSEPWLRSDDDEE
jgi:hypothetical protein